MMYLTVTVRDLFIWRKDICLFHSNDSFIALFYLCLTLHTGNYPLSIQLFYHKTTFGGFLLFFSPFSTNSSKITARVLQFIK
jgi:hypothetical protein